MHCLSSISVIKRTLFIARRQQYTHVSIKIRPLALRLRYKSKPAKSFPTHSTNNHWSIDWSAIEQSESVLLSSTLQSPSSEQVYPSQHTMGVGVGPVLLYVSVEFEIFGQVQGERNGLLKCLKWINNRVRLSQAVDSRSTAEIIAWQRESRAGWKTPRRVRSRARCKDPRRPSIQCEWIFCISAK